MMITPQKGDIIIAPPAMADLRFRKTAILITHHDEDGSIGLCINRPTRHNLQGVCQELDPSMNLNFPLYWGGPINPNSIWMLHDSLWTCANTVMLNDQWAVSSNERMFHEINEGNVPSFFRFFHGMASWQPSQLDCELNGEDPYTSASSWLLLEQPQSEELIEMPIENVWEYCLTLCSQQAVSSWL